MFFRRPENCVSRVKSCAPRHRESRSGGRLRRMGAAARWWTVGLWALMAGAARADHAWDFDPPPDPFTADALLDLSHLNEDVAGEHGFIDVDPHGDFVRGDGEPIRFWAVNTLVHRQGMAALEEHA